MRRTLIFFGLLLVTACGGDRRGRSVVLAGDCSEGRQVPCACADGRSGSQTCSNGSFSACDCTQILSPDAGVDAGFVDSGVPPVRDAGFGQPPRDAGFPPPRDAGFPPPRDAGFPRDAGPPPPPPRDAGFPRDAGPRVDSGVEGVGNPCVVDADCLAGLPLPIPLLVCEMNMCVESCLLYAITGQMCPAGTVCNQTTGHCQ